MSMPETTDPKYSLGEDFSDTGYCNVWSYYPNDELFAVSLPYDSICEKSSSAVGKEVTFMLEGTMYFGLIFLLIIMVQSMKRNRVDWYRLIAFYLVGTLGVPLSNELGPGAPGFNRFIGFGVLVHNMAEAAILAVIWRGTQNKNSKGVRMMILYFWFMLVFITYLPLPVLLVVSSLQGATLDFFLVTSFCTVAVAFKKKGGRYFWLAFAAATMHILSIQPLFLGMMLGWTGLSAFTVICLVPTFMIYIWFASLDSRATLQLAQNKALEIDEVQEQTRERKRSVATALAIGHVLQQSLQLNQNMIQRIHSRSITGARIGATGGTGAAGGGTSVPNLPERGMGAGASGSYASVTSGGSGATGASPSGTNGNISSIAPLNMNAEAVDVSGNVADRPITPLTGRSSKVPAGIANISEDAPLALNEEEDQLRSLQHEVTMLMGPDPGIRNKSLYGGYGAPKPSIQRAKSVKSMEDAISYILEFGLFNSKYVKKRSIYLFRRALGLAFVGSTCLEVMLILAPCVLDTKFLCQDD